MRNPSQLVRRRWWIVPILGLIAWTFFRQPPPIEPTYRGKALSAWLRELGTLGTLGGGFFEEWPLTNLNQNTEATGAIRHFGSSAFPHLINGLTNKDPAWKVTLATMLPGPTRDFIRLHATPRSRGEAVLAFEALGTQAESVVEALTPALYDPRNCQATAIALSALGPRGRMVLTQAINSTNEWAALSAIWALAHRRQTVPGTLDALKSATTNRSGTVSSMAGWALGKLGEDPEHVIPFLMTSLGSTNSSARFGVVWGIGWFGTNAVTAVPLLLESLKNPALRLGAVASLRRIDPEALDKAGVK